MYTTFEITKCLFFFILFENVKKSMQQRYEYVAVVVVVFDFKAIIIAQKIFKY
jgi:hypothetical protein